MTLSDKTNTVDYPTVLHDCVKQVAVFSNKDVATIPEKHLATIPDKHVATIPDKHVATIPKKEVAIHTPRTISGSE